MTPTDGHFNPFDPTGVLKQLYGSNLDAWAKMMIELVNTQAYANAMGTLLDTWLGTSEPFRKIVDSAMTQTLASLKLPTSDDVARLAERFTNVELRLDDLEAKLDETLRMKAAAT